MTDNSNRKLYRSTDDKMITGLSAGIAEAYDMDPAMVRIIVLLVVIFTFPIGLIAYLVAAMVVPSENEK
jgi:phage shock protein PspC (stress-responsive transcriptional regulator)